MEIAALLQAPEEEIPNEPQTTGFITLNTAQCGPEPPQSNILRLTSRLQAAVKNVWHFRNESRYRKVRVLMTHWGADDLGVMEEIKILSHVFADLYHFEVAEYAIPDYQPDRALKRRVIDFVENDHHNTLLIFYYAGHASLSPNRSDAPVWVANRGHNPPSLASSGIQSLIEEAACDALLLYDTCHSAGTSTIASQSSKGVTELIAACGFESIAPEVGEHSFTNALIHVLAVASQQSAFSVSELHSRLLSRLKSWSPSPLRDQTGRFLKNEHGNLIMEPQRRRTPFYSPLTHAQHRREIVLRPLKTMIEPRICPNSSSVEVVNSPTFELAPLNLSDGITDRSPELMISVTLTDELALGRRSPDSNAWLEWIRNAPPDAKEIQISLKENNSMKYSRNAHDEDPSSYTIDEDSDGSKGNNKEHLPLYSNQLPWILANEPGSFVETIAPGFSFFGAIGIDDDTTSSKVPPSSCANHHTTDIPAKIHAPNNRTKSLADASPNLLYRRGPWSPAEDAYLQQLVHTQGALNWVRIAQLMGSRSPKQCRERYHQDLKPTLNHEPISHEEGLEIEKLVGEMGKRWSEIARRLRGRSDNSVKNWWNGSINRRRRLILRRDRLPQPT